MGDHQQGKFFAEACDSLLGFAIQGTGSFVKNDGISLFVKRMSNTDTMLLTARKANTTFANKSVILLWPTFNAL